MSHLVACFGFSAISPRTCCVTNLIKLDQGVPKYAVAKKRHVCSKLINKTRSKISSFLIDYISILLAILQYLTMGSQIFLLQLMTKRKVNHKFNAPIMGILTRLQKCMNRWVELNRRYSNIQSYVIEKINKKVLSVVKRLAKLVAKILFFYQSHFDRVTGTPPMSHYG